MQLGAVMPIGSVVAPSEVRDFAQAAEDLGFDYLLAWEHVLGTKPAAGEEITDDEPDTLVAVHEPFVLSAFVGAVTQHLGMTATVVLPQRQATLVAKQAAEVDVLSGGRLRVAVVLGWVPREFQAMNAAYADRGRRVDEQIRLLRELWGQPVVNFEGRWHHLDGMGLAPRPARGSIPVWIGGHVDASLRRVAALGDGWIAAAPPDFVRQERLTDTLRQHLNSAGRDPDHVGIDGTLQLGTRLHDSPGALLRDPDLWRRDFEAWRDLGANHVSASTNGTSLHSLDQHIDALRRFKESISEHPA
jgi:probable F420-dependent oxidoreductase